MSIPMSQLMATHEYPGPMTVPRLVLAEFPAQGVERRQREGADGDY